MEVRLIAGFGTALALPILVLAARDGVTQPPAAVSPQPLALPAAALAMAAGPSASMPDLPEGSTGAGQPTGADANRREEALQLARTVLSSLEAGDFEGLCVPARPDRTDDGRPSPERLKQVAQCVNWFRDSWFWAGPNLQRQSFLAFKPSPPGGEPGTIVRFTFDGKFPVEMVLEYSGVTGRQELVIASLCAKVPDPETWQQLVPGAPLPPPPCLSVKSQ